MNILESLLIAVRSLFINKLRSILTMLGIIIGVGSVIALMSVGRGAQASILKTYDRLGTNILAIVPRSGDASTAFGGVSLTTPSLTLDDAKALEKAYGVEAVAPSNETFARVSAGFEDKFTVVEGVTPEFLSVMNHTVASGQFITPHDVSSRSLALVLGSDAASALFGTRNPIGQIVKLKGYRFTVVGTLEAVGGTMLGVSLDNVAYIPITTFQSRLFPQRTASGEDSVQQIAVRVTGAGVIPDARYDITNLLRRRHHIAAGDNSDFSVISQQQIVNVINQVTGVFSLFLGAIAGISLIVGGIGIMNIMLVSVTERTREIGIRKSVGAKRRDILAQFLLESAVLSLIGGGIGILGGWLISYIISQINISGIKINALVTPDIIGLAVGVSLVIGIASGLYPSMRAARLNPIDALHYQ